MTDALIKELDGALSALFAVLDAEQIQSDPYLKVIAAKNRLNEALSAPGDAREYLCEGTRFKMSFNSVGNVSCLANFRHELDGKWVALVDATDGKHLLRRPVAPVVTAEDAADRMARLRHQMPLKNLSDIIQNSYLELARAALNVSQPGVK